MTPHDALEAAIERVYAAFAHVPCPTRLDASPLRDGKAILRGLRAAPLRQLSPEQVQGYASYAMTTVGTVNDYRHFLPRLLELAVRDGSALGTEPQAIAGKLVYGEWTNWGSAARDAVIWLFGAALDIAIEQPRVYGRDAEDWLCGLARLGIAPDPWLSRWRVATRPDAGVQLANLVNVVVNVDGEMFDAYWEDVPPVIKTMVADWLFDPATRDRLVATRALVAPDDEWDIELALIALGHGAREATRH